MRQAEARHTRKYALIATDSLSKYARGKLKRRPLTVSLRMKLSLKYRLQADSVCLASDQTEAVFLSLVTHLHCYVCLASACLARIFVLKWTQLYMRVLILGVLYWVSYTGCFKSNASGNTEFSLKSQMELYGLAILLACCLVVSVVFSSMTSV